MMFADDVVLCARATDMLELELDQWRQSLEKRGMEVSRAKTEYMCLNGTTLKSVNMLSVQLPQVTEFKYLGSTLQGDGDLSTEVTRGRSVDGTTGGKCQASYAIREYHHMLKEISTI